MPRSELYYLDKKSAEQIDKLIERVASGDNTIKPRDLFKKITDLLPIKKSDITTVRRRVEGFHYTTELLWQAALRLEVGDRPEIVRLANLKPLSHYHYLTGSREPIGNVLTRADYLNDPSTALVKLEEDILGLTSVFPKLREKSIKK